MITYVLLFDKNLKWNLLKKYLCYISTERQAKIRKYIDNKHKIISLLTELLTRFYLITGLKIKNEEINFSYNENGKPYLLNLKNFHFSVSHSGLAVCLVTNNSPIGLDIEFCRDININIVKRFFPNDEYEKVLFDTNPSKRFFEIWTQKEAYIKLFGLNFLELLKPPDKIKKTHYKCLNFKSYVISVASENAISELSVKNILLDEILKVFE